MVRGLVPPDNLLEWTVEDGWEPLCKVRLSIDVLPTARVSPAEDWG